MSFKVTIIKMLQQAITNVFATNKKNRLNKEMEDKNGDIRAKEYSNQN